MGSKLHRKLLVWRQYRFLEGPPRAPQCSELGSCPVSLKPVWPAVCSGDRMATHSARLFLAGESLLSMRGRRSGCFVHSNVMIAIEAVGIPSHSRGCHGLLTNGKRARISDKEISARRRLGCPKASLGGGGGGIPCCLGIQHSCLDFHRSKTHWGLNY